MNRRQGRQPRSSSQHGSALLLVVGWMSLLLPATLWLSTAAWIELLQVQNARRAVSAFYVAEAGLERALAWVATRASASEALSGPDGLVGTPDDGGVFVAPGQFVPFGPEGQSGFAVTVIPVDSDALRLRSVGYGWGGGTRTLEAIVRWTAEGKTIVRWSEEFDS